MRYLSVCSGIEAATQAWHPLGWEPIAFSEIEPFPCAVLAHHYPTVPNLGDLTRFHEWPDDAFAAPDLLVGGTPCQSFSVAGLRKGLDDPRGNLALTFLALADRYRPRWIVWENVPGVLSSGRGRDFGAFLGALGALGYGWAYRVLDAQYFGLAQRRKRVFVVGYLGDWRRAAAVLLEPQSLCGDPPSRSQAGEGVAPILEAGARTGRSTDDIRAGSGIGEPGDPMFTLQSGKQHAVWPAEVAPTFGTSWGDRHPGTSNQDWIAQQGGHEVPALNLGVAAPNVAATGGTTRPAGNANEADFCVVSAIPNAEDPEIAPTVTRKWAKQSGGPAGSASELGNCVIAHALTRSAYRGATEDGTVRGTPLTPVAFKIRHGCEGGGKGYLGSADRECPVNTGVDQYVGVPQAVALRGREGGNTAELSDIPSALRTGGGGSDKAHVLTAMAVRRLTPVECARLQGFPDSYLDIIYRGKPAADGPKYKALGNSMAVPCIRWIGERIAFVDEIP